VSVKNLIIKPDFSEQLGDIMIWGLIRVMPGYLMDICRCFVWIKINIREFGD